MVEIRLGAVDWEYKLEGEHVKKDYWYPDADLSWA